MPSDIVPDIVSLIVKNTIEEIKKGNTTTMVKN